MYRMPEEAIITEAYFHVELQGILPEIGRESTFSTSVSLQPYGDHRVDTVLFRRGIGSPAPSGRRLGYLPGFYALVATQM